MMYPANAVPEVTQNVRIATDLEHSPFAQHSPRLLQSLYVFLRKWPPIVALVVGWTQLHADQVVKIKEVASISVSIPHVVVFVCVIGMWNAAFFGRGKDGRNTPRLSFLRSQAVATLIGSIGCAFELRMGRFVYPGLNLQSISIGVFFWRAFVFGLGLILLTAVLYEAAYQISTPRLCVIAGSRRRAVDVYRRLRSHRERKNIVIGFIDPDPATTRYLPCDYLGNIEELEGVLMKNPVELVCLALPLRSQYEAVQQIVYICERIGVSYQFATGMFRSELDEAAIAAGLPTRAVRAESSAHAILKRAMDLAGASLLLLLTSPLMLFIALCIKLTSPGPVFFNQKRCGKNRRCFNMYKFRSMVQNAESLQKNLEHCNEQSGPLFKLRRDPRITSVGRVLRMLSLDELPQLLNVLRGEMSLVGPRPLALRDLELISDARIMRRFSVAPGMTGLWQVSGRSNVDFETWVKLDLHYVDRWSLAMDLQILARTVPAVLYAKGAV